MGRTAITSSIGVSIGRQTHVYHAFVTSAPTGLDAPSTVTLYEDSLADVCDLAADPVGLDAHRSTTRGRLVLVDATEIAWQRASCREKRHIFAPADPVLVGPNALQDWLWQRLHSSITADTWVDHAHAQSA